ncbi:aldose epimerase family protein [Arthrobacter sp. RHLT1-20]
MVSSAVITARGAAVRELRDLGRDLIVPFPQAGPNPDYRDVIAAPGPNRVRDGKYTFDGVEYQLPINEPERHTAHGTVSPLAWTGSPKPAIGPPFCSPAGWARSSGYPFALHLSACYLIDREGLHIWHPARDGPRRRLPHPARHWINQDRPRLHRPPL